MSVSLPCRGTELLPRSHLLANLGLYPFWGVVLFPRVQILHLWAQPNSFFARKLPDWVFSSCTPSLPVQPCPGCSVSCVRNRRAPWPLWLLVGFSHWEGPIGGWSLGAERGWGIHSPGVLPTGSWQVRGFLPLRPPLLFHGLLQLFSLFLVTIPTPSPLAKGR